MSTALPPNDLPGYEDTGAPSAHHSSPLDWAGLVLGAARRRLGVFFAVSLLGLGAATAYFFLRPPTYYVETRLLAQRQQALPSMIRTAGADEAPTRTASEFVHQRENLLAIIRETNLTPQAKAETGGKSRLLGGDDEDPLNSLVVRLDRALKVTTGDGVVTISVQWNDPQQAYHIIEAALQNFLEARQVQDITAFDEAIALMQGRVAVLRQQLEKVEAAEGSSLPADYGSPSSTVVPRTFSTQSQQSAEELARLKSLLDAKERAVRDLEEARRRRQVELLAQLEERRGIYSDAHPTVIALRRELAAFGPESAQLVALRDEEAKLREEYRARLAAEPRPRTGESNRPAASSVSRAGPGQESERLREARAQFQNMLGRVNEAQLALDTARAAFKHRYTVIRPAEVPRSPFAPNPLKVFGVGGALSLLLGLFFAVLPDLRAGRVVERWQVERRLDLPVLAEFRAPPDR